MKAKDLLLMFLVFFKIGILTIGGGLVMIPVMQREFVDKRGWVGDKEMSDIFSVAQALPGVIAINSSVYIGYTLHGVLGATVAAIGITLPSFLCILLIYFLLEGQGGNIWLDRFYAGVRCAIISLISLAAIRLGKNAIKDAFGVIIALLGIAASLALNVDMAYIILASGFAGYLYYKFVKKRFRNGC